MPFDYKTLKQKSVYFWDKMKPIQGVLIFLVMMFVANVVWKVFVQGGEETPPFFLGLFNIAAPFDFVGHWVARTSVIFLHLFDYPVRISGTEIYYMNGLGIKIVWGCTAIKQSFIFFCIMLASRGLWKRKLWYIPIGLVLIQCFNVFRIAIISAWMQRHPEDFHVLHEGILKYLFYAFIFLIWVAWEEKFSGRVDKKAKQQSENPETDIAVQE